MTAVTDKGPLLGIRHVQALLIFFNIVVIYISRLSIGIALVAMTNAESTNPNFQEFDWSKTDQSYVISSFYWGYVFTQFPGGFLSRRYGAKITMFGSSLGSALLSLLTPVAIYWGGWQAFCGIRIVQGLFQGMIFPCIHEHLAKWSPLEERNRLGAFSHTGIEFGTVLALFLSGIIAGSSLGWPGIYYVSGGICIAWCVFWFIFASNNAPDSRFIGQAEKTYIESSMLRSEDFHKRKIPVPWKAIFTSKPFYALLVARCAEAYGLSTMQNEIPSYLNGVLDMDIKENALFSALPFLAMWVFSYIYLISSDILLTKKVLSLSALRKTFNTCAFWIPAAALIGVGFLDETQKTLAICLLTLNVGANSGATIGSSLNTIDLSPNHAGILMGIVNTIANFIPIITPLVVGFIVTDKTDRTQWQIVFIIASVIFFLGNLIYIIWGTAVSQPWNAEDYMQVKDEEAESAPSKPNKLRVTFEDNNEESAKQSEDSSENTQKS